MARWSHPDLVSATASILDELERCAGCGLTPDEAWLVTAELSRCPTCEDRDRIIETMSEGETSKAGLRAVFTPLDTEHDRMMRSAAARFTLKGAEVQAAYIRRQRAGT